MLVAQVVALTAHVAVLLLLRSMPLARRGQVDVGDDRQVPFTRLVWLGPGGGGGGGGNRQPLPARTLERPGRDRVSMPTAHPPPSDARTIREPDTIDRMTIPAQPLGSALADLPGLVAPPSSLLTFSQGPGDGGGAGANRGTGSGEGLGRGLNKGRDGGEGGDVYRPGSGVTMPVALHVEQPRYSVEAMRARVQGIVTLECVVRPAGTCSDVHIVRSLDARFGLDEEARKAAALWRFRPGTRLGQPVPVVVRIELEFTMR